jgi:hypothetical protein
VTGQEEKVLDLLRTHLIATEGRLYDQVASAFQWLMATLFAANGGAILGLLGAEREGIPGTNAALGWFGAGVLLSILMGVLSSFWGHRASIRVTTTRFKIERALLEGVMSQEAVDDVLAQKPNWRTWFPSYVGSGAFLCLLIGMLTVARSLS